MPRRHWWHAWDNWDAASVAQDLETIASLGMDHIRIHLIWPLFQPVENWVAPTMVDRLWDLLEEADRQGLDVWVSVLDGWLSGFAYQPAWLQQTAISPHRNMFTDPGAIQAEKLLFRELANRIGNHPRFAGFDLGNELGVMAFFGHPATPAEADAWGAEMMAFVAEAAPEGCHVLGTDHSHWFANHHFSREFLATAGEVTVHHSWASFSGAQAKGELESLELMGFLTKYAQAHHSDPNRLVWQQEFGMSRAWLPEERIPGFLEDSLTRALQHPGHWGFTLWCSHDLPGDWAGFHPCEYDLGLIGQDGEIKESGRAIERVIRRWKSGDIEVLPDSGEVVVPRDPFGDSPTSPPNWAVGDKYFDAFRDGLRPKIVLAD